jgi:hypothetical protein
MDNHPLTPPASSPKMSTTPVPDSAVAPPPEQQQQQPASIPQDWPYLLTSPVSPCKPPHPHPFTRYTGVLHTGQSLSDGVCGDITQPLPALPYALKLHDTSSTYDLTSDPHGTSKTLRLVQLSEPFREIKRGALQYPDNIEGVTPAEGFARQIHLLHKSQDDDVEKLVTVHSIVGRAGEGMVGLRKGGTINAYAASLYETSAITRLLAQEERERSEHGYSVDAILLTHGETDSWSEQHGNAEKANPQYQDELIQLQRDYAQDLAAITKQKSEPRMFLTQQATVPPWKGVMSRIPQMQWRVQEASQGKVVCVGPKYQYGYSKDTLHMPAGGYRRLGEKMAEAYWRIGREGKEWKSLRPRTVRRVGGTIKVEMDVLFPPLKLDDYLPRPHQSGEFEGWRRGRGFEVRDRRGAVVGIDKVKLGEDGVSVEVVMAEPVPKESEELTLAYAMTPDEDGCNGGLATGRIGHLCDSDPLESASPIEVEVELVRGKSAFTGGNEMLALYDTVTPGNYVLTHFVAEQPDHGELSRPWEGETGKHKLVFRHNQWNYSIMFIAKVGEKPWEAPFEGLEEQLVYNP